VMDFLDSRCVQCDLTNKNILISFRKTFPCRRATYLHLQQGMGVYVSTQINILARIRAYMQASAANGGAHFADTVTNRYSRVDRCCAQRGTSYPTTGTRASISLEAARVIARGACDACCVHSCVDRNGSAAPRPRCYGATPSAARAWRKRPLPRFFHLSLLDAVRMCHLRSKLWF
jgi:hypothetical protein